MRFLADEKLSYKKCNENILFKSIEDQIHKNTCLPEDPAPGEGIYLLFFFLSSCYSMLSSFGMRMVSVVVFSPPTMSSSSKIDNAYALSFYSFLKRTSSNESYKLELAGKKKTKYRLYKLDSLTLLKNN